MCLITGLCRGFRVLSLATLGIGFVLNSVFFGAVFSTASAGPRYAIETPPSAGSTMDKMNEKAGSTMGKLGETPNPTAPGSGD